MWQAIKKFFQNLFSQQNLQKFEEFVKEVFTAEKALLLASLKDFALQAVTTVDSTGFDSDTKRKMALSKITEKAQTAGIVVGASMLSLALEMALQSLRNKQDGKSS